MVAESRALARPGSGAGRLAWTIRSVLAAELAIPVGLAAAALLIRLPNLWSLPSLTDEAREVLRAVEIADGRLHTAINVNSYLSAFFNYLLAGLFWLIGPSPEVPRLVALLAGVLTVPAAYLLARDLADGAGRGSRRGRLAGALAAALLAVNGAHVLVNSHIAWSHATTPLFATLGLWLLHRAVARDDRRALAGAAVALGLAVQSHTTALALLPGAAAYALARRPRWLGDGRAWLAALLLVAVNANLLIYNLVTGGDSLARADVASDAYARGVGADEDLYLVGLGRLGVGLLRVVGGAVDVRADEAAYLGDPLLWAVALLAVAGALVSAWRRDPLIVCVTLPYALLFPLFNAKYQVVPNARFLAPLLPLLLAGLSYALIELGSARRARYRPAAAAMAGGVAFALIGAAAWSLWVRVDQLAPSLAGSHALADAVATLEAERADEPVALDPDLDKLWLDGGGDYLMALGYHLALRGIPASELETRPNREQGAIDSCRRNRLELRYIVPADTPEAPRLLADDPATPDDESLRPYWLFRTVQPRDRARDTRRGQGDEWSVTVAEYRPPLGASARAVDRCAPGLPI